MTPRRYGETALARSTLLVGLVLAAAGPSCRSIPITPAALRRSPSPAEERDRALEVWREAVALANEFLASPFNRTMPGGAYTLRDEGMRFAWAEKDIPVEVRSTTWGDLVVWTGFQAQERAYGFVVGSCPPEEDPLLHHSLFRTRSGEILEADSIASLVLHETAHVLTREGTIGFWNSLAYYLEVILLLRTATHSDERIPHAVSEEFALFEIARRAEEEHRDVYRRLLDEHLDAGKKRCRHGPIPEIACDPNPPAAERRSARGRSSIARQPSRRRSSPSTSPSRSRFRRRPRRA